MQRREQASSLLTATSCAYVVRDVEGRVVTRAQVSSHDPAAPEGVRMHVKSEQRRRAPRLRRPATEGFEAL